MKDNISRIVTKCLKCKAIVHVVHWSAFGADYNCPNCGYIQRENTQREVINDRKPILSAQDSR